MFLQFFFLIKETKHRIVHCKKCVRVCAKRSFYNSIAYQKFFLEISKVCVVFFLVEKRSGDDWYFFLLNCMISFLIGRFLSTEILKFTLVLIYQRDKNNNNNNIISERKANSPDSEWKRYIGICASVSELKAISD